MEPPPPLWQTIRGGWRWLVAALLLFVAGCLVGYAAGRARPEVVVAQAAPALAALRHLGRQVAQAPTPVERSLPIFANNVRSILVMLVGGLLLGIIPVGGTFINGALVGIVVAIGDRLTGSALSPWMLLASLAPHGIFELPALWLGAAWGMKLGLAWLLPGAAGHRLATLRRSAGEAMQVFAACVVLLLIAALVEANITPAVVRALHA